MSTSEIESKLTARGIQPTSMRILVLEYLMSQTVAVSLGQVEVDLNNTDRTTLYRTLKTFEDKGLIHGIEDGSGAVKYGLCADTCEPIRHRDMHMHFYCRKCIATTCIPTVVIPDVKAPDTYKIEEINLTAKGLCASCSMK